MTQKIIDEQFYMLLAHGAEISALDISEPLTPKFIIQYEKTDGVGRFALAEFWGKTLLVYGRPQMALTCTILLVKRIELISTLSFWRIYHDRRGGREKHGVLLLDKEKRIDRNRLYEIYRKPDSRLAMDADP